MSNVVLAGATGYLGRHIAQELSDRGIEYTALVRDVERAVLLGLDSTCIQQVSITDPMSLFEVCNGADTVISTVGITRQKDGLNYEDVDFQGNLNLLNEAKRAGVRRFIYVSALQCDALRHLKICDAKERFVDALIHSGLEYCIIRPNGFFSDMEAFIEMAQKGRIYLFGHGEYRANPIHGQDLAQVCVDACTNTETLIEIGGPEILTQNQMAATAFKALGKTPKITHLPDSIRKLTLFIMRCFTGVKTYGPIEFFLTVFAQDMISPSYGKHTLLSHFKTLNSNA